MNKLAVFITGCLFALMLLFTFQSSTTPALSIVLSTQERIDGNTRRVDYVDEDGTITVHPSVKYATKMQTLDQNGNPIEEYYLDVAGLPVACSGGYYGIKRIYDAENLCIQYTFVDQNGNPTEITSGYAAVKQIYNDQRQVVEVYYLDHNEQKVALTTGQYGELREYDTDGRNYMSTYIDADGNPMENTSGYSTIKRTYNADGQVVTMWYYDLADKPVYIGRGQCGTRYEYENGEYVRTVPIDADGKAVVYPEQILQKNPWLVGIAALSLVIIALFLNRKANIVLIAFYVLFILYMTLLIRESGDQRSNLELFWSYRQLLDFANPRLDVYYNIWLFVPLGALLCALKRAPKMLLFAVGLTIFIEITQYIFGLGLCEFDDIIGNSLGAWLGWGCFCEGRKK